MLQKLQNLKTSHIVALARRLKDVRFVGFLVFGVLVLLVSWSGVGVIETNYQLEKQAAVLRQQNQVANLQNENQKLQNTYFATSAYQELVARRQFGRAAPGEKLVLVPKSVALARSVDLSAEPEPASAKVTPSKPIYQQNLEAWRGFITRQSPASP